jgi:hypothetical protein
MKRLIVALGLSVACAGMAGCADDYYGPRQHGFYEHHPIGYEGYYDGHYGAVYDGYWGDGGAFYYSTGEGSPYVADSGGHFRRDAYDGYAPFHGGVRRGGS